MYCHWPLVEEPSALWPLAWVQSVVPAARSASGPTLLQSRRLEFPDLIFLVPQHYDGLIRSPDRSY
jgi:hypothetical protein